MPAAAFSLVILAAAVSASGATRAAEYAEAARRYEAILKQLPAIDAKSLGRDDQIDASLLEAHVRTRLWEIATVRLHQINPSSYLRLDQTRL